MKCPNDKCGAQELIIRADRSMVELLITRTGKSPHPQAQWTRYDHTRKTFESIADAKAWLKREYCSTKTRKKCWHDRINAPPVHCGWVYCFKVTEDGKTHYEQHWVTFQEVRRVPIDLSLKTRLLPEEPQP